MNQKEAPEWIDQAQAKAGLEAQKLAKLFEDRVLFQVEYVTEDMVQNYIESYHAALEPVFTEMKDAGWQIVDKGVARREGNELGERFERKKLLQKYPLSQIREARWGIMDLNSKYFLETISQRYFISTADERPLALMQLTPVASERSHLGGMEISILNTNVAPNNEAPQIQGFNLKLDNPEDLTVNMDVIKARFAEIIVHREVLNTWKSEEERKWRDRDKINAEKARLAQVELDNKLNLINEKVAAAGKEGIAWIDLMNELRSIDFVELRHLVFDLEKQSSLVYKDGKYVAKKPKAKE